MLSPEDALKRIAARYDMENHYFAQPEEWIYEIKTGVKFEVQDRKLVEGRKCQCGCLELKEVVDHHKLTSDSGDHVRRPM